jgi:4-amino-4-deoxy-L-arabinose transferase-like glycosyltransferase
VEHPPYESRAATFAGRLGLLSAVLLVAIVCLVVEQRVLDGIPHGVDAAALYYQGQVFAAGRLVAPAADPPASFAAALVVERDGRRFAIYPPGWPMLLGAAMLLGSPALANALMTALCGALSWILARRLLGPVEAWMTLALLALSPFFMFMGASYLTHLPCATLLVALSLALVRALDARQRRAERAWAFGAGLAAGMAVLVRPYSALLGGLGALLIAASTSRDLRRWRRIALAATPPVLLAAAALLAYNRLTTGSPLVTGYHLYAADFGFLGARGQLRASLADNVAVNLPRYAAALGRELWGSAFDLWPTLLALAVEWRRVYLRALAAAAALYVLGYSAYYYFDLYFGPRLVFEAFPWIAMTAAVGLGLLWRWARTRTIALPLRLVAAALLAIQLATPLAVSYPQFVRYYAATYAGQSDELLRAVRAQQLTDALVLVRSNAPDLAYTNLYPLNAVEPERSPVLFARAVPAEVATLVARFPRRDHWLLDVDYEKLPGRNVYPDRFQIRGLQWTPLHIEGVHRSPPG